MLTGRLLRLFISLFAVFCLCGCGPHFLDDAGLRDETVNLPSLPDDHPAPPKGNGTIYQAGFDMPLYEDHLANRIGDILTVRLEETTNGQKKAKTKTIKDTTYAIQFPSRLDIDPLIAGSDFNFNGDGEADQQNQLHGTISVTVCRVLSNNNLIVSGESWLTINQGREYVRLTGIVRRDDIEPNNIISSTRIAHARITYSGGGQVGNNSRAGAVTQLLLKYFPF